MQRLHRLTVMVAVSGMLVFGGIAVGANEAQAATVAGCHTGGLTLQGSCTATTKGYVFRPASLTATVDGTIAGIVTLPTATISWSGKCLQGASSRSITPGSARLALAIGSYSQSFKIPLPYGDPDQCRASVALSGLVSLGIVIPLALTVSDTAWAPPPGGYYFLPNGPCLDDTANSLQAGTPQQIWKCSRNAPQHFSYTHSQLMHYGYCLADGGGAVARLARCNNSVAQIWIHAANGEWIERSNGLCLTDPGNSVRNGTRVLLEACTGAAGQRWHSR